MIIRCRDCSKEKRLQHPISPRVWVCSDCDHRELIKVCPGEFDFASLKAARAESEALFNRATNARLASAQQLTALTDPMVELTDEAAAVFEPHLRRRFGIGLSEFHERLVDATADALCEVQKDNRYRHEWFAQCVLPLRRWWKAQGFSVSHWRARDDDPADNAPYLEFLSHELGRMESVDAAQHVGIGGVQKLAELTKKG